LHISVGDDVGDVVGLIVGDVVGLIVGDIVGDVPFSAHSFYNEDGKLQVLFE